MTTSIGQHLPVSISAAVLVEDPQGRLLLVQQAAKEKGHGWAPPGGKLLAHEDSVGAALREAKEELGVAVRLKDLVGVYTVDRGDNATSIAFVFRATLEEGTIRLSAGEIRSYRFFTADEIRSLVGSGLLYKPEFNLRNLQDWLGGHSYPLESVKRLAFYNQREAPAH